MPLKVRLMHSPVGTASRKGCGASRPVLFVIKFVANNAALVSDTDQRKS